MNTILPKFKRITYIELLFIALLIPVFISPELNRIVSLTMLLFIELCYSAVLSFVDCRFRRLVITNVACALVIAGLYTTTTEIVYIELDASNRILKSVLTVFCQYYSLTFPILLFYRVFLFSTDFQRWILAIISFISFFVVVQSTLSMLAINERIAKQGMGVSDELEQQLVGGYSFVCAIPFIVSSLFYMFLRNKNVILKVGAIILAFFLLSFIVKTQYSIALIASLLGILSSIFVFVKKRYHFFCIIGLLVLCLSLPSILDYFIERIEGDVHLRMIEIRDFIKTGDMGDDDMAARVGLYGKAFVSFLGSPIWGNYSLDFNAHSTFFEVLASLGILGVVPLVACLKSSFNVLKITIDHRLVTMLFVPFVFMGLSNPIHISLPLNMSLWLISPLIYMQFSQSYREF